MKAIISIIIFALMAPCLQAQTNLTELLQKGMLAEQADHNINAAIADYEALSTQFDKDRQLAATAIFRLGECFREKGLTNQAAMEYQRILNEFPDQKTLARLSQEDLAGMGASSLAENSNGSIPNVWEKVKDLSKPDLEKVLPTLMPDAVLTSLLQQRNAAEMTLAQKRAVLAEANPEITAQKAVLTTINQQISERISGIMEALKIQNAAAALSKSSVPANDEDQEIARLQAKLQDSPDLINAPDEHGHTPLENAAINGSLKVAAFLLDHSADVNAGKFSALNLAANAGNRAMVDYLLSRGANINAKAWRGETPLHNAASEGYQAVTEVLLQNRPDVNAQDDSGATPLLEAARNGHWEIVQRLLKAGADPNLLEKDGRTPLSLAAASDSTETVKALLAEADPNAGTMDAPLLGAVDKQDLVSAELLLRAGANPNVDGPMHCPQGSYGSQWHPEYSAILRNATPLWLAIQNHQLPMVQLLLKYKANPDAQTSEPPPVIFWALSDTDILQALLDGGANPNVRNQQGETPLKVELEVESENYSLGNNLPPGQQMTIAASIADLLRRHGALEALPDWDRIMAARPSAKASVGFFFRGTNNWNQFTLLELLFRVCYSSSDHRFAFPDFTHITIVRPNATGEISKRIPINLLNSTNGVDCSRDVPLEFGDVVEIPEREHSLAETDTQTGEFIVEMSRYLKEKAGTAKLIVDGGQTVPLPLKDFEPVDARIHALLGNNTARRVLKSNSDLSRVKVTRGEKTWMVDCSDPNHDDPPDLWVRDGDLIEVPEIKSE
ncbi:MAG TPA: ankyrin repeat domain-containing protein [Verrucomicrobiae bacterium]|jgi:ankyrin repeat protein|nr:ankyrin repeat domain-containing protein [Verrucomicrobiae bacterium]